MLRQNTNALGIIFPNSYDNTVPELVTERAMASICLLYTSPSPRDRQKSRMPSSA